MPAVAAPADKRFRRAHVKPGAQAQGQRLRTCWLASRRLAACLGWRCTAAGAARRWCSGRRRCRCRAISVRGNERLSTGEVLALVDGLRGRNILTVALDEWQQRLLASPWVEDGDAAPHAARDGSTMPIRERRPMGIGRDRRRALSGRRERRRHRRVRTELRRSRPADHRRAGRTPADERAGAIDEPRARLAARADRGARGATRSGQAGLADRRDRRARRGGDARGRHGDAAARRRDFVDRIQEYLRSRAGAA